MRSIQIYNVTLIALARRGFIGANKYRLGVIACGSRGPWHVSISGAFRVVALGNGSSTSSPKNLSASHASWSRELLSVGEGFEMRVWYTFLVRVSIRKDFAFFEVSKFKSLSGRVHFESGFSHAWVCLNYVLLKNPHLLRSPLSCALFLCVAVLLYVAFHFGTSLGDSNASWQTRGYFYTVSCSNNM